jgi:hypothetical protein
LPVDSQGRQFIVNGKRVQRVNLSLDTPWWDGEGRVSFVGGSGTELTFSGVDSTGVKRSIPLQLMSYTPIKSVGDMQRDKERILAPLRLARTGGFQGYPRGSEASDGKVLQVERSVPVEHFIEMGLTKGSVSGRLSAAQFVLEKTGEVSLATSSEVPYGSGAVRFSKARLARRVVESDNEEEKSIDVVRVEGVMVGLPSWRMGGERLVRGSLMPRFHDFDDVAIPLMIGSVIFVHPDGVHAVAAEPEARGVLLGFGWGRTSVHFDLPLSGIEGLDGSGDFPPIAAGDIAKMRLIIMGAGPRKRIKVTIPATPWELSDG